MLESAALAASSSAPVLDAPGEVASADAITGTWSGRAWQQGNKSWPLTVTFEPMRGPMLVAHAQYPDQRCSGDWALRVDASGEWQGDETIRQDPLHRCVDHGHVALEVADEDTLRWRWSGAGTAASATLERAQH